MAIIIKNYVEEKYYCKNTVLSTFDVFSLKQFNASTVFLSFYENCINYAVPSQVIFTL